MSGLNACPHASLTAGAALWRRRVRHRTNQTLDGPSSWLQSAARKSAPVLQRTTDQSDVDPVVETERSPATTRTSRRCEETLT